MSSSRFSDHVLHVGTLMGEICSDQMNGTPSSPSFLMSFQTQVVIEIVHNLFYIKIVRHCELC